MINNIYDEIVTQHPICNTIGQKAAFCEYIKSLEIPYPVVVETVKSNCWIKRKQVNNNIIIGDAQNADVILTVHDKPTVYEYCFPQVSILVGIFVDYINFVYGFIISCIFWKNQFVCTSWNPTHYPSITFYIA